MKHNPVLDAMRGRAIIGVLLAHVGKLLGDSIPAEILQFLSYGKYGVQVFFIVSAFTIFLSIGYKVKHQTFSFPLFMTRRFFRIFPLFFVIFTVYFLIDYFTVQSYSVSLYLLTISFLKPLIPLGQSISYNIGLERTLTVEVLFYCIAPWLYLYFRNQTVSRAFGVSVGIFVGTTAITLLLRAFPFMESSTFLNYLYTYPIHQISVFLFGIVLYYTHYAHEGFFEQLKRFLNSYSSYGIVGMLFLFGLQYLYEWYLPFPHLLMSVLISLVLWQQLQKYSTYLVNTTILYLGKISYSILRCYFN